MAKKDVMQLIEREWNAFVSIAESFKEEDRVRPGAIGHWNVHEGLLHIAAWDNETMLLVRLFEESEAKPEWHGQSGDTLDDLNEGQVAARRNLEASLIWEHFRGTHQALVVFLENCDEHVFTDGTFTGDAINAETWQHYNGHGEDFTRFKETL